jgi:tetratricopeptide (TPR) repeat protein
MSSIIEGYNYDIFISYRQKDNKGDRWVSEFVEALKTELESTFKEEISVYFDINPHDGLLETHDVDASLKEKLKCLIFIPIISRTYCDPKSFAWEHEFKAFIEEASKDQFGLKVKLPGGNVASRVLPVQIHELDPEDKKLIEEELGGYIRGVEFIYSEPGVNRPLKPDDDEKINLNKTKYRNQINKVGNAIKESISGFKTDSIELGKEKIQPSEQSEEVRKLKIKEVQGIPARLPGRKLLTGVAGLFLVIIAVILAYPKIFHSDHAKMPGVQNGKMSIVVNTFANKTGDATMDPWKENIPDLLRGYLTLSKVISVQKSKADWYVTGSFQKVKDKELIVINLVRTTSDELLLTRSVEGNLSSEYKEMADSLSRQLRNYLEIKSLEQTADIDFKEAYTNSAEAYEKYLQGTKSIMSGDYPVASKILEEAYRIDTTYAFAAFFCSFAYCYFDHQKARYWEAKAYPVKDRLPEDYQMWLEFWHGWFNTKNINDILNYCGSIEKSYSKSRFILFDIGCAYHYIGKLDKSLRMFEKVKEISSEMGNEWKYNSYYIEFADACQSAGRYDTETSVLETALKFFPDDIEFIWRQARLALTKRDTGKANGILLKYNYLCRRSAVPESMIMENLGSLYEEIDSLNKAEEYYRQALKLDPDNPSRMNQLAYFLIDKDRDIAEGWELINKAMILNNNNINFLHTKGWGLFKQGKYKEAIDLLEKCWGLSPSYSSYNVYFQLQEAKKAVANQKNN